MYLAMSDSVLSHYLGFGAYADILPFGILLRKPYLTVYLTLRVVTVTFVTAARVWACMSFVGSSVAAVLAYGPLSGRSCLYSISYIVI